MGKYIMALDQGTTSSRCIIYCKEGRVASMAQKEFTQIYPREGWVEHDAMEIWSTQIGVAQEALHKINATFEDIEAIGITNQRETTIVWDKNTGRPVYNAIVWQCRRTADYCEQLKEEGMTDFFRKKTGLLIDPYFSGTKLKWILDNVKGAREKAEAGDLLFGTVETWLIWKLTRGRIHITDYTNASRTMMFNINDLAWDKEILEVLNIPESMLPTPVQSSEVYGETDPVFFGGPIKIAGAAGDQQAALFGQTCFAKGSAKNTYGTGCFLLMNIGDKPIYSEKGLITTIAWGINGEVTYALEGSVFVGGAVIQWLRDELRLIDTAAQSEDYADSVPNAGGVYIVPAFVGLGAPYWDPYARGTITGITRGTNKYHIVRAALESIAYQVYDLIDIMEDESGIAIMALNADGGACVNNFLMQFQSDLLNRKVQRPDNIETTSLGAAYLAGLATGFYDDMTMLNNTKTGKSFKPHVDETKREKMVDGWRKAVGRSLGWDK
ncbi:MAG: glycerol kinase GlpK [Clostridiales bacterium]|nr:glycerol kinase GlpK [Clostridiales bacterium]